jgi:hypothetical protein
VLTEGTAACKGFNRGRRRERICSDVPYGNCPFCLSDAPYYLCADIEGCGNSLNCTKPPTFWRLAGVPVSPAGHADLPGTSLVDRQAPLFA